MKRPLYPLFSLVVVASMLLAACQPAAAPTVEVAPAEETEAPEPPAPAAGEVKIVVIGKSVHPYWSNVELGVKAAGKDLGLGEDQVRSLSVAEQQMVEIAKALGVRCKVIIMDEPTSALGKEEVRVLFDIIQNLKEQGLAIIFITHRLEEVFEIADRVIVFRDGRRVGDLLVEQATADQIIAMMVGRTLDRSHCTSARLNPERSCWKCAALAARVSLRISASSCAAAKF